MTETTGGRMSTCHSGPLARKMRLAIFMLATAVEDVEAGLYSAAELDEKADALQVLADQLRGGSTPVIEPREEHR